MLGRGVVVSSVLSPLLGGKGCDGALSSRSNESQPSILLGGYNQALPFWHLKGINNKSKSYCVWLLIKSFLLASADVLAVSFPSAGGTGDR